MSFVLSSSLGIFLYSYNKIKIAKFVLRKFKKRGILIKIKMNLIQTDWSFDMIKILCIGDIVGRIGRDMVFSYLDRNQDKYDLIIANGENAAHGRGITKAVYEELKRAGIDGITLGNHTWGCPDVVNLLKYNDDIIRPANFDKICPGKGSMILKTKNGAAVGIVNVIGRVYMQPADSPFEAVNREIELLKNKTDIIMVDFHAEATSEKIAMGYYLDGKVSAVFGTHTHVQTADESILPNGTGYMTDLGMTGPIHSVLGMEKNTIIKKFIDGIPARFEPATGKGKLCGCVFDIDEQNGKAVKAERVYFE